MAKYFYVYNVTHNIKTGNTKLRDSITGFETLKDAIIYSDKKGISLTKLTGALITLVCLIGIVLCFVQGGIKKAYFVEEMKK